MVRTIRIILAVALALGASLSSTPVSGTECTPKGCSINCRIGDPSEAEVDTDTMRVRVPAPIVCSS